jgi:hypothetical protein
MKARHADPEFAARNAARMKARHADPEFAARLRAAQAHVAVTIPQWVPRDLWAEFLDIAAAWGEERAASHARRLKQAAAQGAAA